MPEVFTQLEWFAAEFFQSARLFEDYFEVVEMSLIRVVVPL